MDKTKSQIIDMAIGVYTLYAFIPQMIEHIKDRIPNAELEQIELVLHTIDSVVDTCFDLNMKYNGKLGE